jgi:hypothetical protein
VKRRPSAALFALLLLFASAPLFSADPPTSQPAQQPQQPSQYALGDQTLSISAGAFLPLFFLPNPAGIALLGTQLSVGGMGSLSWAAYVTPQIRVGVEIGGAFTLSPNLNTLLMLPIMARGSYVFTVYPFEIPLTLALGMNVVKYTDKSTIDLLVRPGASFMWIFNSSWTFGVNANWWIDMQFAPSAADSRVLNALEISLTALYHY